MARLEWQGLRVSGLVGLELFVWQPFETLLSRNTSSPLSSTSCRNLCCFIEAYATYTTAVRTLTVHVNDCRRFDAFLSFHKAAVCRMIELEADVLLDHLYFLLENRSFMCWANQVILSQPLERRVCRGLTFHPLWPQCQWDTGSASGRRVRWLTGRVPGTVRDYGQGLGIRGQLPDWPDQGPVPGPWCITGTPDGF